MKITLSIFLSLFCCLCFRPLLSQPCPSTNVILENQAEIDNFAIAFGNCEEIYSLTIREENYGAITSLAGLESIKVIDGNLTIDNNRDLLDLTGLDGLIEVTGQITIEDNRNLDHVSALSNLTTVGDVVQIKYNDRLTSLEGLQSLENVGYNLLILENPLLHSIRLDALHTVSGTFRLSNNPALTSLASLTSLTTVGEDLSLSGSSLITDLDGLQNLTTVGRYFNLNGFPNVSALPSFSKLDSIGNYFRLAGIGMVDLKGLEALKKVGDYLEIWLNPNLKNLDGLENLQEIGGGIILSNNDQLVDLSGLNSISSVDYLEIEKNDALLSLEGLESITKIEGNLYIDENQGLQTLRGLNQLEFVDGGVIIRDNHNLENLQGLESLKTIGEGLNLDGNLKLSSILGLINLRKLGEQLSISNSNMLTNLDGLGNLVEVGGPSISISDNSILNDINGLVNVDFSNITELELWRNYELTWCGLDNICRYLINGVGDHSILNSGACYKHYSIIEGCTSQQNVVYDIFYDLNQNKVRDSLDKNYAPASIRVDPGATFYFGDPNHSGRLLLAEGQYEISYYQDQTPNWALTTDSASFHLNITDTSTSDSVQFGIFPSVENLAFYSQMEGYRPRCNTLSPFQLVLNIQGTIALEGTHWVTIDPAIDSINFILPPDTLKPGNCYGWHFDLLFPGERVVIPIELGVPGPPDFPVGDYLHFMTQVDFTDPFGQDQTIFKSDSVEVRCSYDPNDKLVSPNRPAHQTLFEEQLRYTIRFQNTGNDVAYDVVIRDTLDPHLDLRTFYLLNSSHLPRLETSLSEDRELTFTFENIFLPDSTTSFEGSQGFVTYLISPYPDLPENTVIQNTAGIYFDQNPPVITNTTENILVSEIVRLEELPEILWRIFPNPNDGQFWIQVPSDSEWDYRVHDCQGRVLLHGDCRGDAFLDLGAVPSGIYFITIYNDKQLSVQRMVRL